MENLTLNAELPTSSTACNPKKALKRPRDDMRNSTADVMSVPMVIDGEVDGTTGSSDGDSGRSDPSESFEQVCDRHVRRFLRANSAKVKPSTQQGLEPGDRTPSGGVFVAGVPRMFGGGNCFGRNDSIGSKSDVFSQQDPSELPPDLPTDDPNPSIAGQLNPGQPTPNPSNPDQLTGGQPLVGQPIAGQPFPTPDLPTSDESNSGLLNPDQPASDQPSPSQPNPGPPNPNPSNPDRSIEPPTNAPAPPPLQRSTADPIPSQGGADDPPRCLNLRGGSAELELSNVALTFALGAPESNDRQPRGFEPLDLPSSSTHGQAVMDEPKDNEEESPPSRARENFGFLRHPEALLSREPGPSTPRGGDPGASTSGGVVPGAEPPPSNAERSPPSPDTSFDQRVEYLSQQFIDPPSNPGSSSHSAASSFDSKRTASSGGSPEDFRETSAVPRGGEPVPWRELFDLLPEARRGGPRDTVMSDPNRPGQPSSSGQPGSSSQPAAGRQRSVSAEQSPASSGDNSRPRISITLSPGCSPDRSIVLPGLPDDLAMLCVARVPRRVLAQVKCVSKAWAMLIRSEELYKIRGDNALSEPWLYALCESPRWGPWRVYDPVDRRWHFLRSPLPGADRQLVHAKFSTIALHEKMLVVGGCYFRSGDPSDGTMLEMDQHALRDLRVYDPVKNRWSWAGDMNIARRSFAIGEIDGKVYVAGGLGQNGELLNSAEVYDPSTNRWTILPSMSVARYGCAGAVLHGKLWTYAGRIHAGDENPGGWRASSSAEVFDPETATWRTVDEMWMRKDLPNPAAVLDEMLYTVDCEDDCKIKCYREATNSWFVVDQLPLPPEIKHAGSRLVAFNGELYMLGGTIFYRDGDLNRGRNVNTVEIFNPGALARGENAWRSAPNMGDGRGGIWGCAVLSL